MKTKTLLFSCLIGWCATALYADGPRIDNPHIDYPAFQRLVVDSGPVREAGRLSEDAFLEMMKRPGVVVLDARTDHRYRRLHITGAVNLPFTEFTAETLAAVIPSFDTPVLIYCNNNFEDRRDAFPTKSVRVALNVSTYTSLRAYGYTRVYELGPLLRVATSRLPFSGAEAAGDSSGAAPTAPPPKG